MPPGRRFYRCKGRRLAGKTLALSAGCPQPTDPARATAGDGGRRRETAGRDVFPAHDPFAATLQGMIDLLHEFRVSWSTVRSLSPSPPIGPPAPPVFRPFRSPPLLLASRYPARSGTSLSCLPSAPFYRNPACSGTSHSCLAFAPFDQNPSRSGTSSLLPPISAFLPKSRLLRNVSLLPCVAPFDQNPTRSGTSSLLPPISAFLPKSRLHVSLLPLISAFLPKSRLLRNISLLPPVSTFWSKSR